MKQIFTTLTINKPLNESNSSTNKYKHLPRNSLAGITILVSNLSSDPSEARQSLEQYTHTWDVLLANKFSKLPGGTSAFYKSYQIIAPRAVITEGRQQMWHSGQRVELPLSRDNFNRRSYYENLPSFCRCRFKLTVITLNLGN